MCQRLVASGLVYLNLPIAYSPGLQRKLGNVVFLHYKSHFSIRQSELEEITASPPSPRQLVLLLWWAVPPGFANSKAGHCSGASPQGAFPGHLLDLSALQHLTPARAP